MHDFNELCSDRVEGIFLRFVVQIDSFLKILADVKRVIFKEMVSIYERLKLRAFEVR